MLLNLAESLVGMDFDVTVIGPSSPSALVDAARQRGLRTVVLEASSRISYLSALRRWDRRHREGLLWCNGLLPAVATASRRMRIVHLHQRPSGMLRLLACLAKWRAVSIVVPSANMASVTRGSQVLYNWVAPVTPTRLVQSRADPDSTIRVGFLGRPSIDKGVDVLCAAITELKRSGGNNYRLVLAGESRFVATKSSSAVDKALEVLGDTVERTGWITPAELFGRVDVLVCPSVWPEPFGLVVAEAFSAKVPVVVSDAGALPEVVGMEHPWIAKKGDVEDLARMISLASEADEASLLRSYVRWKHLFSPSAGAHNLKSFLTDLGYTAFPEES